MTRNEHDEIVKRIGEIKYEKEFASSVDEYFKLEREMECLKAELEPGMWEFRRWLYKD